MKYGEEAVYALLQILNERDIQYMLVGSFSSNAYGEPRSTKDADFVINIENKSRQDFLDSLPTEFVIDQQISFETIGGSTRQILMIPSIPFEIELFDLSEDKFDQARFKRKVSTKLEKHQVWLPTPEDVIIQKLRWAKSGSRDKDFLDALGILRVRKQNLDWQYIESWCVKLDLDSILKELRSSC